MHKQQLAVTNPYLISGQVALVHLDDFKQLGNGTTNLTEPKTCGSALSVTVPVNLFIRGLKPKGTTNRIHHPPEAVQALIADTIDAFIFDLPANFYYASLYVDKGLTPGATL